MSQPVPLSNMHPQAVELRQPVEPSSAKRTPLAGAGRPTPTFQELTDVWGNMVKHIKPVEISKELRVLLHKFAGEGAMVPWHIHFLIANLRSGGQHVAIEEDGLKPGRQKKLSASAQARLQQQHAPFQDGDGESDSDSDQSGDDSDSDKEDQSGYLSDSEKKTGDRKRPRSSDNDARKRTQTKGKEKGRGDGEENRPHKDTLKKPGKAKTDKDKDKDKEKMSRHEGGPRWDAFWDRWMTQSLVQNFAVILRSDNPHATVLNTEKPPENIQQVEAQVIKDLAKAESLIYGTQINSGRTIVSSAKPDAETGLHGEPLYPVIVPPTYYRLFRMWRGDGWHYVAVWDIDDHPHHIYKGTPLRDCLITRIQDIDHDIHDIQSPVWSALQPAMNELELWTSYLQSVWLTVNQSIVVQDIDGTQQVNVAPTTNGIATIVAKDLLNQIPMTADQIKNTVPEGDFKRVSDEYARRTKEQVDAFAQQLTEPMPTTHDESVGIHLHSLFMRYMGSRMRKATPYSRVATVPIGKEVASVPQTRPEPSIIQAIEKAEKNIAAAFGLPPLMTGAERSGSSTNSQSTTAFEVLNTSLQRYKLLFDGPMAEVFAFVYDEDLTRHAEARCEAIEVLLTGHSFSALAQTSSVGTAADEDAELLRGMHLQILDFVRRNVHVRMELQPTPLRNYDELLQALQHKVIDHPEFRAYVGKMLHIPDKDLSTEDVDEISDLLEPGWRDKAETQAKAKAAATGSAGKPTAKSASKTSAAKRSGS